MPKSSGIDQIDKMIREMGDNPTEEQIGVLREVLTSLLAGSQYQNLSLLFDLEGLHDKYPLLATHPQFALIIETTTSALAKLWGLRDYNQHLPLKPLFSLINSGRVDDMLFGLHLMVSQSVISVDLQSLIQRNVQTIVGLGMEIDSEGYYTIKNIRENSDDDPIARMCYKICCSHITSLNVSASGISSDDVDIIIDLMPNLDYLDLSSNKLKTLPESIGELEDLKEFKACDNNLQILSGSISRLGKLKELDLSLNDLQVVPDSIGELGSLEDLDLSNNQLQSVPDSIGKLGNLERLDLGFNRLRKLTHAVGSLHKLMRLSVDNNNLQSLPKSIVLLEKLLTLTIVGNSFPRLPACVKTLAYRPITRISMSKKRELEVAEWLDDAKHIISFIDEKSFK